MRFEVGVDIVENSRFTPDVLEDKSFMEKYFTENERGYCFSQANPAQHFAARFAGKEAVVKALYGFGIKCRIENIEIVLDELNVPRVITHNIMTNHGEMVIKISLSHSDSISIAYSTIYSK